MKLHEFQAKELCRRYSLPLPPGRTAENGDEARSAARALDRYPLVVKAQVPAGGRGKGGGVRIASNEEEVAAAAASLLGSTLVTSQTGPAGVVVRRLLLEQWVAAEQELYLAIIADRATASLLLVASNAGGIDIEAAAATASSGIVKVPVDPLLGIQPFHCRRLAFGLALAVGLHHPLAEFVTRLFRLFVDNDCALVEINPLAVTTNGGLIALDAKIELEENGLKRHPELMAWRDEEGDDPQEVAAGRAGLHYVRLPGTIGTMVNGAGLAMATMDLISQVGGEPANFLDVGGGASAERIREGFAILLTDPRVKAILINIVGGILRCDLLAEGIVQAARAHGITVPVVIRLEGTNAEAGRRILAASGLTLVTVADLAEAAARIALIIQEGA